MYVPGGVAHLGLRKEERARTGLQSPVSASGISELGFVFYFSRFL